MVIRAISDVLSKNLMLVLLVLSSVVARGARVDFCCDTVQCHHSCAAASAYAVPESTRPLRPLVNTRNMQPMSLLQSSVLPDRITKVTEDEHKEEQTTKDREERSKNGQALLEKI